MPPIGEILLVHTTDTDIGHHGTTLTRDYEAPGRKCVRIGHTGRVNGSF